MQTGHPELFGSWDRYSTSKLVKLCDRFNESQLFRSIVGEPGCRTLSDIGCATGRYYRFFRKVWPSLQYKGFDISEGAINQAKTRFPDENFSVFDGRMESVPDTRSDIIWSRDVVHHQTNPSEFLSDLYDASERYLVLRVRTREVGTTVFDVSQSCQYTYGRWVPFIVYNTSELIDLVRSFKPAPARIVIMSHPAILGGLYSRFLPKELYYSETGAAETAVLIEKGVSQATYDTVVTAETRLEAPPFEGTQWLRRLARRLGVCKVDPIIKTARGLN